MDLDIRPFCEDSKKHKLLPDGTCAFCNETIVKDLHNLWYEYKKFGNKDVLTRLEKLWIELR